MADGTSVNGVFEAGVNSSDKYSSVIPARPKGELLAMVSTSSSVSNLEREKKRNKDQQPEKRTIKMRNVPSYKIQQEKEQLEIADPCQDFF